jgi:hypothetical protein
MIVTRAHIPRRAVLRGLGATVALPFLDAMVPALTPRAFAAASVRRFGAVFVPMGMNMAQWTPATEGTLALSPILQPLSAFRDRLVVVSGLDSAPANANDGAPHPRCQTSWLTGASAFKTEGAHIHAGVSMDQIAAREFGKATQLASLELTLEAFDLAGNCAGYSCAYNATVSWRTPTTPLPMEANPRAVFERMFGATSTTDAKARLAALRRDRSILDAMADKISALQKALGSQDRVKVTAYLEAVRDVERRIQKAEEQSDRELPLVEKPVGAPTDFMEHGKLLLDLQALALQTDLTRVFTFAVAQEQSTRTYPEIGVTEPHHPVSHHGNMPDKLAWQTRINTYHLTLFAYFLEKLRSTPDGDGTLLDHSILLYGGAMSNPNIHLHVNLPLVVAGGGVGRLKGGRHLSFTPSDNVPMTNLLVSLLDKGGVRVDKLGDSTGRIDLDTLSGI